MSSSRSVTKFEGQAFAEQHSMIFIETSALERVNVARAFQSILTGTTERRSFQFHPFFGFSSLHWWLNSLSDPITPFSSLDRHLWCKLEAWIDWCSRRSWWRRSQLQIRRHYWKGPCSYSWHGGWWTTRPSSSRLLRLLEGETKQKEWVLTLLFYPLSSFLPR